MVFPRSRHLTRPDRRLLLAGTAVTITGINLTGATVVKFGTVGATSVVVVNSTTITCVSPAHAAAGVVDVTVTTPAGTSATTGTGNDYTYGLAKFAVTMSGGTTALSAAAKTAGTPFNVRVTAQDANGNTVTSYTGTVVLTSNAFAGTVNATITAGGLVDAVAITPTVAGVADRTISAAQGPITTTNASGNFTVNPGILNKFAVTMSGGTTALSAAAKSAGTPFNVRVTAQDANGNTVTAYTGTVALTSNAFAGTVNAPIAAGGLVDAIAITPTVVGSNDRTITAAQGSITTTNASGNFTVNAGATTKFLVTMTGGTTPLADAPKTAGTPFSVRVTAQNASGITVTNYTGTVHLTSTAFAGTVDATITSGGVKDAVVIMPTITGIGGRTISATDGFVTTANASGFFTVEGGVTSFKVTMSASGDSSLCRRQAGRHVRSSRA